MREFENFEVHLRGAEERVQRLYAVACYGFIKTYAGSFDCDSAVAFAALMADGEYHDGAKRHHQLSCNEILSRTIAPREASKPIYRTEVARELAVICVADKIDRKRLLACVWGLRGFLGEDFDRPILDDLDIIGPDLARRDLVRITPREVVSLARAIYDGDHELYPILADAAEDCGLPTDWVAHLRTPGRHWRGCWVVDALK